MGHSPISPTIGDQFPEVGLLLRVEGRADIDVVVDPDVRVMKERVVVEVDVPRRDVPIERGPPPSRPGSGSRSSAVSASTSSIGPASILLSVCVSVFAVVVCINPIIQEVNPPALLAAVVRVVALDGFNDLFDVIERRTGPVAPSPITWSSGSAGSYAIHARVS